MTDTERKTKLEERVKTLKEMRDVMLADEHWENMKRLIEALTVGEIAIQMVIYNQFDRESCKTCKHYTPRSGNTMSKTRKYCNRTVTLCMNPNDFCSRWEGDEDDE